MYSMVVDTSVYGSEVFEPNILLIDHESKRYSWFYTSSFLYDTVYNLDISEWRTDLKLESYSNVEVAIKELETRYCMSPNTLNLIGKFETGKELKSLYNKHMTVRELEK